MNLRITDLEWEADLRFMADKEVDRKMRENKMLTAQHSTAQLKA